MWLNPTFSLPQGARWAFIILHVGGLKTCESRNKIEGLEAGEPSGNVLNRAKMILSWKSLIRGTHLYSILPVVAAATSTDIQV